MRPPHSTLTMNTHQDLGRHLAIKLAQDKSTVSILTFNHDFLHSGHPFNST